MNKKKLVALILTLSMVITVTSGAMAQSFSDFTDISNHWAKETMEKAFDDGILEGDGDKIMPNAAITPAQMITILCRVLNATEKADISSLNIPDDAWYKDVAAKAMYLGLIDRTTGNLTEPMTRQNALTMMSKAFALTPADPDLSVLNSYSDNSKIIPKNRASIAALISQNLVHGFAGELTPNSMISRAEFVTILYRVAPNYVFSYNLNSTAKGGSIVSGSGNISNKNLSENIWFDCSVNNFSFSNINAKNITLRSNRINSLNFFGSTDIQRLVVAASTGKINLVGYNSNKIGTIQVEGCESAKIGKEANKIEITGNGMPIEITDTHSSLIISGDSNTVILKSGASVQSMKILGKNNIITTENGAVISSIIIPGNGNRVTTSSNSQASLQGSEETPTESTSILLDVSGEVNTVILSPKTELSRTTVLGEKNTVKLDGANSIGAVTVNGNANSVSALNVYSTDYILINGNNHNVNISSNETTERNITVLGSSNTVTTNLCNADTIRVEGDNQTLKGSFKNVNSVSVNGNKITTFLASNEKISVSAIKGKDNQINLTGNFTSPISVQSTNTVFVANSTLPISSAVISGNSNWVTFNCPTMEKLSINGNSCNVTKTSEGGINTVEISGKGNAYTQHVGNTVDNLPISGTGSTVIMDGTIKNSEITGSGTIVKGSGSADNVKVTASDCSIDITVANLDNSYVRDVSRIQKLVTTTYKGNYTLAWAQSHDYKNFEKEIWINSKGYSSRTNYLIWINIACQRVNIFKGSKGNWTLVHDCIVGTGSYDRTPRGTYTTTYKLKSGWQTESYLCRPVVGWNRGTGYAFHSRLYWPNSSKLKDANIGFPISHGCIRMYDNDINYIYNNVPTGTTVVSY